MIFSSKKRVKIDKALYKRLAEAAMLSGYSSTEELIEHVLERAVSDQADAVDQQQAEQQLRGLGYIE